MAIPERLGRPYVARSEQDVLNTTFDETFGVMAVIPTEYDPVNDTLVRSTKAGAGSHATNQVSITTTATQIVAARLNRQGIVIINLGSVQVFIGGSGVTAGTGLLLEGIAGASIFIPTTAALYGITAAGSQTISYMEIYG